MGSNVNVRVAEGVGTRVGVLIGCGEFGFCVVEIGVNAAGLVIFDADQRNHRF